MVTHLEFAERVVSAVVLGSAIGVERQWRQRLAGLRTNALVATGTCLFILVTPFAGPSTSIAAYVVSGIGFLAGGVIFKERGSSNDRLSVTGLNTAATLWCTAAVGELVGFGSLLDATIGVTVTLAANILLRPLARDVNRRFVLPDIGTRGELTLVHREGADGAVRSTLLGALQAESIALVGLRSQRADEGIEVSIELLVIDPVEHRLQAVIAALVADANVISISTEPDFGTPQRRRNKRMASSAATDFLSSRFAAEVSPSNSK